MQETCIRKEEAVSAIASLKVYSKLCFEFQDPVQPFFVASDVGLDVKVSILKSFFPSLFFMMIKFTDLY